LRLVRSLLVLALLAGIAPAEEEKLLTTPSGLKYEVLSPGKEGERPKPGDKVKVHYTGTFTDGRKFDSSRDRGKPFEFVLGAGQVIAGWDEGVALMSVGSRFRLHVPSKLGYGERGSPPGIPPNTDLVFDVELLSFTKGEPIPEFRDLDEEKAKKTDSGILFEVLEEGTGRATTADDGVAFKFAVWNTDGDLIVCDAVFGGLLGGQVKALRLGRLELRFLKEAALLMKVGSKVLFKVPPSLCFGARPVHPKLPGSSTTIWRLELVKINEVPKFDAEKVGKGETTESGLVYLVIEEGEGESPKRTDTVKVHYTGWLTDGRMFDSSHARGDPAVFPLNRVIPGWTEGVALMKPGAKYLFTIPGKLAYGRRPPPGSVIGPDATLVFLVELIEVVK
jgi:peptidylprolyl isomerase